MKTAIPIADNSNRLKSKVIQGWRRLPIYWRFLIVVCLLAGIVFRVVNIDGKVYWNDETYTSLRVSGYTEVEAIQHLSHAGLISAEDLQKISVSYQS